MPASITMSGLCIRSPIHISHFAPLSANSFPSTPSCPFTTSAFSVVPPFVSLVVLRPRAGALDRQVSVSPVSLPCYPGARATTPLLSHASGTPSASASDIVAIVPQYITVVLVAAAALPPILLPSVHSSTLSSSKSFTCTLRSPLAPPPPIPYPWAPQ